MKSGPGVEEGKMKIKIVCEIEIPDKDCGGCQHIRLNLIGQRNYYCSVFSKAGIYTHIKNYKPCSACMKAREEAKRR